MISPSNLHARCIMYVHCTYIHCKKKAIKSPISKGRTICTCNRMKREKKRFVLNKAMHHSPSDCESRPCYLPCTSWQMFLREFLPTRCPPSSVCRPHRLILRSSFDPVLKQKNFHNLILCIHNSVLCRLKSLSRRKVIIKVFG